MVSKFFNDSPLWEGNACMKGTNHCVRHRGGHHSNSASVREKKQLNITGRSIWTRLGSVLGGGDLTFHFGHRTACKSGVAPAHIRRFRSPNWGAAIV